MKFCKDCKFFKKNNEYVSALANIATATCMHEKVAYRPFPNLVTSEVTINRPMCKITRSESSFCGPEGKLFKTKETTRSKLKSWFNFK